jgi:hypothetical protein
MWGTPAANGWRRLRIELAARASERMGGLANRPGTGWSRGCFSGEVALGPEGAGRTGGRIGGCETGGKMANPRPTTQAACGTGGRHGAAQRRAGRGFRLQMAQADRETVR